MKPTNVNNPGCNPISSNCVIWQGPDIECIKLCKGDNVSEVVAKLATELCTVMDQLDIKQYDLSCFNLTTCGPEDFQGLIRFLIEKICSLDECCGGNVRTIANPGDCPDCVVSIAPCFNYVNQYGDTVTTMLLSDYTKAIGNRICSLVDQITNINATLANHEIRIETLENAPTPEYVLPDITPVCTSPAQPTDIITVLTNLERQFCELMNATGNPDSIFQSIIKQCVNLNSSPALGTTGGVMSALSGWISNVQNLAQSHNNMWLAICDLRAAVATIKANCCPSGCDGIEISLYSELSGSNLILYITGTIPSGFEDCNPLGNLFTISDTVGGSFSTRIIVKNEINVFGGTIVNLASSPLNLGSNLTIHTDLCLTNPDENTTCQFCIDYVARVQSSCPALTITATTDTSLNYSFNVVYVPGDYTVELWNNAGTAVVASSTVTVTVPGTITGTFTGLAPSVNYRIRITVTIGGNTTDCAFTTVTTLPVTCDSPTGVSALLTGACDTCGSAIDFVSNPSIDGWYVDDDAKFLQLYQSGTFNDFFEVASTNAAPGGPFVDPFSRRICYVNGVASPSFGKHFVTDFTGKNILVYNNNVLETTISVSPATPYGLCYDESKDRVYFITNSSPSKVGYIDASTLAVGSLDIGINFSLLAFDIYFNPFNQKKYVLSTTGGVVSQMYIIDTDDTLDTLFAAGPVGWGGPSSAVINPINGDVWLYEYANGNTNGYTSDIIVVDSANALATTINYTNPYIAFNYARGTYYPGNGTAGTERIVFPFVNSGTATDTRIVEFTLDTYTPTTLVSPGVAHLSSVLWSVFYGKYLAVFVGNLKGYDLGGNEIADISPGYGTMLYPVEDLVHSQVIYVTLAAADNVLYVTQDTDNVTECVEGKVEMYLTEENGPYEFNTTTSSWDSMVNYSSIVDNGTTITVTALLANNATGIFTYSTDGGLTWTTSGAFLTATEWAAGVTITKPVGAFMFRISILTEEGCGLGGAINTTFN